MTKLTFSSRLFTLPNIITIGRILCIPFVVYYLLIGQSLHALIFFMIAAISDALDGFIARYMHARSKLGAYLDPLADKLLFFFTFLTLGYLNVIPYWLIVLSIGRDAIIIFGIGLLKFYGITIEIKPLLISKMNTLIQSIVVVLFLVMEAFDLKYTPILIMAYVLVYMNVMTLFISGIGYIQEGKKSFNRYKIVYLITAVFLGLFLLMAPHMMADGEWLWLIAALILDKFS